MSLRGFAVGCVVASLAVATTAAAADKNGPISFSGHAGIVSDYVTRGFTQTWGRPALQAELEAEHDNGLYAGTFVSSISNKLYPGGTIELDVWAGYEHELGNEFTLSAEGIYYLYPSANFNKGDCRLTSNCPNQRFDTFQARLGLGWRWMSARVSYALTDYFGDSVRTGFLRSTKGTTYWEANADYPLPIAESWHLVAHLGYTRFSAKFASPDPAIVENPNYWDWRLGVTKAFKNSLKGWRVGAYYSQASNRAFYDETRSLVSTETRDLGRPTVVLAVDFAF